MYCENMVITPKSMLLQDGGGKKKDSGGSTAAKREGSQIQGTKESVESCIS